MTRIVSIFSLFIGIFVLNNLAYADILVPQSKLLFVIKQEGAPVEGGFKVFSGNIHFDQQKPDLSHADIVVALTSIDFASTETEDEAKGKNWFNTALFPNAEFKSTHVRKMDNNHYEVEGILSIKNIKKPIKIPISLSQQSGKFVADGQFVLLRSLFQVGQGVWADPNTVADEVLVKFHMVFNN